MKYLYIFEDNSMAQVEHETIPESDKRAYDEGVLDIITFTDGKFKQYFDGDFVDIEEEKIKKAGK